MSSPIKIVVLLSWAIYSLFAISIVFDTSSILSGLVLFSPVLLFCVTLVLFAPNPSPNKVIMFIALMGFIFYGVFAKSVGFILFNDAFSPSLLTLVIPVISVSLAVLSAAAYCLVFLPASVFFKIIFRAALYGVAASLLCTCCLYLSESHSATGFVSDLLWVGKLTIIPFWTISLTKLLLGKTAHNTGVPKLWLKKAAGQTLE
jgi:hypothetical protein